jgi:hypothetical protein
MAVPPRESGHRFATMRTAPILTFPETQQGSTSFERGSHLERESLLKIALPLRIVGISLAFDLGVPCDGETMGGKQVDGSERPFWAACLA